MTRHFTALLTLVAGTLATPALPAAPEFSKGAAVELCRQLGFPDGEGNLGECTSYVMTFSNPNGFPAHDCDAFMEGAPELFFSLFDSYSDCVRTAKSER
jgi:hypothetical protein